LAEGQQVTGPDGRPGDGFRLSVDLGTSNTVAMLRWPDGRTRPLLFDGQPLLPSAVYLDTTGRLHVGRDALRLGYAEPARFEPHPKRHIDAERVLLGGTDVAVSDLFAALLGAVAREVVAAVGFLPPAVVTFPAAWGQRRRGVLTEALGKAGWPADTLLVPEPVAAARYFADVLRRPVPVGSALAVFDLGGGTLDIAVVRNEALGPDGHPRFEVAACGGADDLGGLDLDAALVEHLGKSLSAAESTAWAALTDPETLAQWRARRQFWEDVRGAKEMLSRSALAPVPVPGVESAVHLTRDELEAAAGSLIRRSVAEAGTVIRAAGLTPRELAGLFLVGGSTRVPMVARVLHSELGIAPTVLEQPELPVAEGAIIAARSAPARPAADSTPSSGPGGTPIAVPAPPSGSPGTAPAPQSGSPGSPDTAPAPQSGSPGSPDTVEPVIPVQAGPVDATPALAAAEANDMRYRRGVAEAATPPPTAETVPNQPPPTLHEHAPPVSRALSHPPLPVSPTLPQQPPPGAPPLPDRSPSVSPATGPRSQPPSAPTGPEPEYGQPVDPWATGEAAAIAAANGEPPGPNQTRHGKPPALRDQTRPGEAPAFPDQSLHGTQPAFPDQTRHVEPPGSPAGPAPGRDRGVEAYRKKWFWFIAAAVAVVVAAGVTLAVIFWPRYPALDYQPLAASAEVKLAPAVPIGSRFTDAGIVENRAYFATESDEGRLGVVAADLDSNERVWSSVQAGVAERWEQMVALPNGVAAFTAVESGKRRMVFLGASDGAKLWERVIGDSDGMLFFGDVAVLVDRVENRLLWLDVKDRGTVRKEVPNIRTETGTGSSVISVTSVADLSGPASIGGGAFAPDLDDDQRIVQINADRSARVLNAVTGELLVQPQPSVADPDDEAIAHNGRLIVRTSDTNTERILAYDLAKFGQPRVLWTAPTGVRLTHLTSCGADRVCWVETAGFETDKTTVAGVDAAKGGTPWRRGIADVDSLVPVGDAVLARQNSSPRRVALLNTADGSEYWNVSGDAVRLDAGNVLHFTKALSSSPDDPSLSGWHVGDQAEPLGALSGVRTQTCSWNTARLACVGDQDLRLLRFAE
jgi:hypothetical protein